MKYAHCLPVLFRVGDIGENVVVVFVDHVFQHNHRAIWERPRKHVVFDHVDAEIHVHAV